MIFLCKILQLRQVRDAKQVLKLFTTIFIIFCGKLFWLDRSKFHYISSKQYLTFLKPTCWKWLNLNRHNYHPVFVTNKWFVFQMVKLRVYLLKIRHFKMFVLNCLFPISVYHRNKNLCHKKISCSSDGKTPCVFAE